MGDIQSPLADLCQCHLQGFALSCPGIFFSQVNAQTELMMKRKYKKLKVVVPYLYKGYWLAAIFYLMYLFLISS